MTNVFHTGRPRGSITTATAVTNGARPVAMPRGMKDGFRKLKRIFSTYLGFVGPGILISIAYMVPLPRPLFTVSATLLLPLLGSVSCAIYMCVVVVLVLTFF
jgi:hypothetical protein